ncbi:DUF6596 domain-containing protein [Rhizobium herbae]
MCRITEARRAARLAADGTSVPIASQDRKLWNDGRIAEGLTLLDRAMARRAAGPFQVKAAIAALHVQSEPPDWRQIVLLYDSLLRMEPTPVVQLNRAVALAEAGAPEAGLRVLESLAQVLDAYQPFHAAHAELLSRCGRTQAALAAYDRAIDLASNPSDAIFLSHRRAQAAGNI